MGQPAYAGVAVGLIFLAIVGALVGYKVYKKVHWRRYRKRQEAEAAKAELENGLTADAGGPPIHFPMRSTSPGPSMVGSLYGDIYPTDSMRGSMSKASFYSNPTPYQGSSASEYGRPRRASSQALFPSIGGIGEEGSADPSVPGSPTDFGPASPADTYDGPRHGRALSSASSTMTLKRSYAGSSYRGMSGSHSPVPFGNKRSHSPGPLNVRRDSYLPHLPENRNQVQIVPPQPLGFSFGMAQALDQRTLAFSKGSGIGDFDEEFSRGLLWAAQNGREPENEAEAEAIKAAAQAHIARGGSIDDQARLRYLAEGPSSRSFNPTMRGAIHNHLYDSQPGSSGARTPDGPSRPRSPAQANWDGTGSSSDIGPSVSQRGAALPSHPLENVNQAPYNGRGGSMGLGSEQSPLGLMKLQLDSNNDNAEDADISLNTVTGSSPILKAFQNPSSHVSHATRATNPAEAEPRSFHTPNDSMNSTHAGIFTPGLSNSDSRSLTSSRTGPPSLSHHPQHSLTMTDGRQSSSADHYRSNSGAPRLQDISIEHESVPEQDLSTSPKKEKRRLSKSWLGPWGRPENTTSAA
ncbi:uncharacterized protein FA14DRAFT_173324 [Meira miltonrushii]|uniref:Uncharacterized protein n=1 Tax=Meira miltonrushii TaxID=1280837 RepID=A0A316VC27_9BASI|nr:uncharacterized protein FA14DRAFT_173324 [Meira miltonrushii]PWN33531.1 hypothetical protein FA14DRAFT_173324 [Meira miltonrushii]